MQSRNILTLGSIATAVINEERFIGFNGATAAAGANALGASETKAAIGERFPVNVLGTAIVVTAEAISEGSEIEVGADGKAAAKNTGKTVARAIQAATGADQRIEVLLIAN